MDSTRGLISHILQVGDGHIDHAWWGRPEDMTMARPAWKIDEQNPGSDLAGETAASMAAASILFKDVDPVYSETLLDHAKELFSFADNFKGRYSDSIANAKDFYKYILLIIKCLEHNLNSLLYMLPKVMEWVQ